MNKVKRSFNQHYNNNKNALSLNNPLLGFQVMFTLKNGVKNKEIKDLIRENRGLNLLITIEDNNLILVTMNYKVQENSLHQIYQV